MESPDVRVSRRRRAGRIAVTIPACVWIAATVWAAAVHPAQRSHEIRPTPTEGALVVAAMAVALFAIALPRQDQAASPDVRALVIVAATWAGLAAERTVCATDALAVAAICLACAPAGPICRGGFVRAALFGGSIGISPLLIAAVRSWPWGRRRTWAAAVVAAVLAPAVVVWAGRDPWAGVRPAEILLKIGPAAVWRQLSDWITLMLPVLCLGLLAAVSAHGEAASATRRLHAWAWINFAAALIIPKIVLSHTLVFLAPYSLLASAGWRELGALAGPNSPLLARMIGASALLLALVMTWQPLHAAAAAILPAIVAP